MVYFREKECFQNGISAYMKSLVIILKLLVFSQDSALLSLF